MPSRHLDFTVEVPAGIAEQLAALRTELKIPDQFPAEVDAAAERVAGHGDLPEHDRTDLELVTIDPPGAQDLDQAMFLERDGHGYVVWYAIADLSAFVTAGDPVDVEARHRGQTLYAPDRRTPLHPAALSEHAASLLPGEVRPSYLWRIAIDAVGAIVDVSVRRALVRSREQLTYEQVQTQLDAGTASESLSLLAEVGPLREAIEAARGGISLNLPEQEIAPTNGEWHLVFRERHAVEGWNAQISLLTGIAAAHLMINGKVGVLRTLPPADDRSVRRLREGARALGLDWPAQQGYPEFVRSLDPAVPAHVAMLNSCTTLFRGAGYASFSGGVPDQVEHAALATPYAHATAPLRRLGDRWVLAICAALCADEPVPDWAQQSLDEIPDVMTKSDQRAKRYERDVINLVEAHRLAPRIGQDFPAVIIDVDDDGDRGKVMVTDPAVEATVRGTDLPLGERVTVRLAIADPEQGKVEFELVS